MSGSFASTKTNISVFAASLSLIVLLLTPWSVFFTYASHTTKLYSSYRTQFRCQVLEEANSTTTFLYTDYVVMIWYSSVSTDGNKQTVPFCLFTCLHY